MSIIAYPLNQSSKLTGESRTVCGRTLSQCSTPAVRLGEDHTKEILDSWENEFKRTFRQATPALPPVQASLKIGSYRFVNKGAACLRAIFAHNISLSYCNHSRSSFRVKAFPGMIEIKLKSKKVLGSNPTENLNQRGKITEFSTKSRRRLIKTICRFPHSFDMRFELTFADDVMEGLNQEERSIKGSTCLHRLQTWIERNIPSSQIIWKREWEPRKSGLLKDQVIPHYHFMMHHSSFTKEDYENTWIKIAVKWVKLTCTKDNNAFSVALHQRSRGFLEPDDRYVNYFGKYISKSRFEEGEGIGKFWGKIGELEQSEGEQIPFDDYQVMQLKRLLRKYLQSTQKRTKRLPDGSKIRVKPKRRYENHLKYGSFEGFIAMRKGTIERLIEYVERR